MNFGEKNAAWFFENEGGGSTAVWNFSKNSSVLVGTSFPKFFWQSILHMTSFFGKASPKGAWKLGPAD